MPRSVVVATSDKKALEVVRNARKVASQLDQFRKLLKDPRFTVEEWKGFGVLVLDRQAGPIAAIADKAEMAETLVSAGGPSGTLQLGALAAGERVKVQSFIEAYQPRAMQAEGSKIAEMRVGVDPCVMMTVRGANGREIVLPVPHRNPQTERAREELQKHPLGSRRPSKDETLELTAEASDRDLAAGEVSIHVLGPDKSLVPQAVSKMGEFLDQEIQKEGQRLARAGEDLLRKLRIGRDQLGFKGEFAQMPAEARDGLIARLRADYKAHGFSSPSDAEDFLSNSTSVGASTTLSLVYCQRPSDPSNGRPGVFIILQFASLPGAVWP